MKVCRHGYMSFCPYNTRTRLFKVPPSTVNTPSRSMSRWAMEFPQSIICLMERGPRIIRESGWQVLTCVRMCVCGCERGLKV